MNIFEPIKMGFDQLRLHKMRAALSILGILISVGSVTGIVSMGDGLRLTIMGELQRVGSSNHVRVSPPNTWYRKGRRWLRRDWEEYLTNRDVEYFKNEIEHIRYVVPVMYMNTSAQYRNASTYANVRASNEHFYLLRDWKVESGRFINKSDIKNASKVAVIGAELARDLYGDEDPVGKELKIEGMRCRVVGVLAKSKFFHDTNERNMVIPYTTVQKRFFGNDRVNFILLWAESPEYAEEAAWQVRHVLNRFHDHGEDFRVTTGESEINQFNRVVTIMKIVAGGIAGISLIVGGIGIMNIMLVSVTERTREIGIRMAIGAKRSSIMSQFILESIVLCLFGGVLGIILGIAIGFGISSYIKSLTEMPFESIITPWLMAFAILYSSGIGLFFGIYPAYRASKLDPVEALRHE
ncbi:ABC transporter permease [Candidatus Latescibacterota bacterium]